MNATTVLFSVFRSLKSIYKLTSNSIQYETWLPGHWIHHMPVIRKSWHIFINIYRLQIVNLQIMLWENKSQWNKRKRQKPIENELFKCREIENFHIFFFRRRCCCCLFASFMRFHSGNIDLSQFCGRYIHCTKARNNFNGQQHHITFE